MAASAVAASSAASAASMPVAVSAQAASTPSVVTKSVPVVAASTPQPFVIALDSMPPGGFLEYTQVFGTLAIAIIVAWVTYVMQKRHVLIAKQAAVTAQHKLNLDLFEKRWPVYDTARRFIGSVVVQGTINDDQLQVFLKGTGGAKWLFDEGVAEYLKDFLYDNAMSLQTYVAEMGFLEGEDRDETRKKIRDLKELFQEELKLIDERMGKFMRVVSDE